MTAQHLKSSATIRARRAVKEPEMGKLFLIGMAIAAATLIGMAVFVIQLRSARGEAVYGALVRPHR